MPDDTEKLLKALKKEVKATNKLLEQIKLILDNTWRERSPTSD